MVRHLSIGAHLFPAGNQAAGNGGKHHFLVMFAIIALPAPSRWPCLLIR